MTLLLDNRLNINRLSQIFNNTVATYKFYWFLSILELLVKNGNRKLSLWEIIAGMIAEAWYPVHYFKLSFGKSDSLYEQIIAIQRELNIPIDASKDFIKKQLLQNIDNNGIKGLLRIFSLHVPYRFLSPWITYTTNSDVVLQSQMFQNDCLYALNGEIIEINSKWEHYLIEHYTMLKSFTFWNLTLYLQKRNPNVPDVPSKLIKPILRDSLTKQHKFWDSYIDIEGPVKCIYTGKDLFKKEYDLDHFVPWSFVSHNLIWNLLPIDSSINSSKSNNLPLLDVYLKPYALQHKKALSVLYPLKPNDKMFEDYLSVFDSVPDLIRLSDNDFIRIFQKTFTPMVQIAENMGFSYWHNNNLP